MAKILIELDTNEDEGLLAALLASITVTPQEEPEPAPSEEDHEPEPEFRAYGEATGKRRTKAEIALDTEIEELFAKLSHVKGLPKTIPTDVPAEGVLEDLKKIEADHPVEEFDVGGDDKPMDLEEFRALCLKAKTTIGKDLGKLMAPYKSAPAVPEDERNEYAAKIQEAITDAE